MCCSMRQALLIMNGVCHDTQCNATRKCTFPITFHLPTFPLLSPAFQYSNIVLGSFVQYTKLIDLESKIAFSDHLAKNFLIHQWIAPN